MQRYEKYNYLAQSFLLSKVHKYHGDPLNITSVGLQAGHFRFAGLHTEHGLIFVELAGQVPNVLTFTHGKRMRHTAVLATTVAGRGVWPLLDRFINVVLPSVDDLRTPKMHKAFKLSTKYTWRIRNYFEWSDTTGFMSDRMFRKDVFMPLFLQVSLSSIASQKENETYLRMLRLPFAFYKWYQPKVNDSF